MNPKQQESHLGLVLAMSLGGAVLGALIMAVAFSSSLALKYKFIIILGALLLVALLVVAILWWRRYRQDGRSFKFRERLKGMLGSIGSGRSAEEQAAVEQMRRKFEALIPKLREAGRDIYEMPWFLIIGPSGSGKSWVLRAIKSLVPLVDTDPEGRPSGASATAGKGGTLMMDWWTCPDAIVLDTAGGVVFPEEKAYESPEWELLLDLLRKYRPECPINGLLVVIPAEMLLLEAKDLVEKGATTLEEYAESLRGQIRDRLQRGLQIRFPVYFLITKSDRIPGFREFSDEIESVTNAPKLKDQIVGWSNAAPVGGGGGGGGGLRAAQADSPLRKGPRRPGLGGAGSLALLPESAEAEGFDRTAVEAYLRQVAEDLRRRRTTILDRYAGAAAGGMDTRRMAATLFSFPSALERMAPRLQAFLEVVFQPELQRKPDEVDKMPPFVRGIYITSAMREGEVLDPLRARRKGVSLARLALPGGPERNVKKAFFLNDLFSQKILFESGLVMPLVAARQYLISRRRKLVWTGIVASLALLTVFSVGAWNYYVSVGKKLKIWAEMGRLASTNALYWRPVVTNSAPGGYALDDAALKEHLVLANSAAEGLKSSRLGQLYDLPGGIEAQLPTAQCLVFERGVVRPLADFAKAKLSSPMTAPPSADIPGLTRRYEDGLLAWIELGCIPEVRSWPEAVLAKSGDRVIGGALSLLLSGEKPEVHDAATELSNAFTLTYRGSQTARWTNGSTDPAFTNVVQAGFRALKQLHDAQSKHFEDEGTALRATVTNGVDLAAKEKDLLTRFAQCLAEGDLGRQLSSFEQSWMTWSNRLAANGISTSVGERIAGLNKSIAEDSNSRQQQLRNHFAKLTYATQHSSNLPPLVDLELKALQSPASPGVSALNRLEPNPQTSELDSNYLASLPAVGGAKPKRLVEGRLQVYQKFGQPKTLSSLVGRADAEFFKDLTNKPGELLAEFTNAVTREYAGLLRGVEGELNYPSSEAATSLTNILAAYLRHGYHEAFTTSLAQQLASVTDGQLRVDPPERLLEGAAAWGNTLDQWSAAVAVVKKGLNERSACPRQARVGSALDGAVATVDNTRERLAASLTGWCKAQSDSDKTNHFPLGNVEPPLLEKDVLDQWDVAVAFQRRMNDIVKAPDSDSTRRGLLFLLRGEADVAKIKAAVQNWLSKFDYLVEETKDGGKIRQYQIGFPNNSRLAEITGTNTPAFKIARDKCYSTFRDWTFRDVASDKKYFLEADVGPDKLANWSASISAATGLQVAKVAQRTGIPGRVLWDGKPDLKSPWTVLRLIFQQGTVLRKERNEWEVPFEVGPVKGPTDPPGAAYLDSPGAAYLLIKWRPAGAAN